MYPEARGPLEPGTLEGVRLMKIIVVIRAHQCRRSRTKGVNAP